MTDLYEKTTNDILIRVRPVYLEEQSTPEEGRYVWAYHVTIENQRTDTVQLRSRYWRITDSFGVTQEVEGEGVVGDQPVLAPGETYEYASGAPLPTPGGFMVGAYTMCSLGGESFKVDIPAFSLDSPHQAVIIH